jgi:hypothetical protein
MSINNKPDQQAAEILRQAVPVTSGNLIIGATAAGAASQVPPAPTTTIVDDDGKVRRPWLVGDDFSDEFYFDWRPA